MIAYQDTMATLYSGHVLDVLPTLDSVQCVVTSPPYWGLQAYKGEQERVWGGGWRGGLGNEPTVEMYISHLVEVFGAVRRVLRADGVCFVNIGDSYCGGGRTTDKPQTFGNGEARGLPLESRPTRMNPPGLKNKDLCLVPERFALAMQADGWWVRSRICWSKPNPMPESVRDRPTDSWEHIWMFTKSAQYYWDQEAVRECLAQSTLSDRRNSTGRHTQQSQKYTEGNNMPSWYRGKVFVNPDSGRNLRSVWAIPTESFTGAHFATFPTEIPRRCILAASKEGDTVLDPFAGSGTTLAVAKSLGRKSIGIDLAYHDLAAKRVAAISMPMIMALLA